MTDISAAELYDLYLDTVGRCTSEIKSLSDEEIEYNLFEEFDVGAHSYLHDNSLDILRHAGFIDDEMVALSKQVRKRWIDLQLLQQSRNWTIEEIKTNKEWLELFALCDQLKLKAMQLSQRK